MTCIKTAQPLLPNCSSMEQVTGTKRCEVLPVQYWG